MFAANYIFLSEELYFLPPPPPHIAIIMGAIDSRKK
jgi:hypothetical protein